MLPTLSPLVATQVVVRTPVMVMQSWHHNDSVSSDYSQVSTIRHTLVGNKIVDHSDVVGPSPVGAAPTTSSFST